MKFEEIWMELDVDDEASRGVAKFVDEAARMSFISI